MTTTLYNRNTLPDDPGPAQAVCHVCGATSLPIHMAMERYIALCLPTWGWESMRLYDINPATGRLEDHWQHICPTCAGNDEWLENDQNMLEVTA